MPAMPSFAIGVDLGGTNLRIAAVDEQGTLLEKVTLGTHVARGRDFVISEMCDAIRELSAKFSSNGRMIGAGIGIPGIIDKRTGMLRESPNLPGWHNYPVRNEIEQRLGAPVLLENDANAAAFGEAWLGAARGQESMCMITLGTGVGGGIGARRQDLARHDRHGGRGRPHDHRSRRPALQMRQHRLRRAICLRHRGGAHGAGSDRQRKRSGTGPCRQRAGCRVQRQDRVQPRHPGRPAARDIFNRVGWALGILVADLVNMLNLNMYVIGGGVAAAWSVFSPAMFEEVRKRSMVYAATAPVERVTPAAGASGEVVSPSTGQPTIITRALLGSDAGLYGAARLPMVEGERREDAGEGKRKFA